MSRGEAIVAEARKWIGTPYAHQGCVRGVGADCLGLVRGVFEKVCGRPTEAPAPYSESWAEVAQADLLLEAAKRVLMPKYGPTFDAGDVLLFRMRDTSACKHLGIVGEAGASATFIHAYTRHGVLENSLSRPWRRRVAAVFSFPEGIV